MYTIGIDVSKKELVSAKVTKRGEIIERWTIPNEPVAIAHWLDALPHALLGAEATAEYHNELARQCIARGVPFKLLNPLVTKQFSRATLRRRKTDRSDAEVIARCLLHADGLQKQGLAMADETQTKLLSSIPGIGKTLSATISSEIGDCGRFGSGKAL